MREITLVGNLTRDFEVRFFEDTAVANSAIAVNSRYKDKETGEWKDADKPHYFDISVWGTKQADQVVESLGKGNRVIVVGNMDMTVKELDDGTKRTYPQVRVEHIGPDLRWATVKVSRVEAKGSFKGGDF